MKCRGWSVVYTHDITRQYLPSEVDLLTYIYTYLNKNTPTHAHGGSIDPVRLSHLHIQIQIQNSIYPLDTQDFDSLELAVNKLTLNDASVSVQVRFSVVYCRFCLLG